MAFDESLAGGIRDALAHKRTHPRDRPAAVSMDSAPPVQSARDSQRLRSSGVSHWEMNNLADCYDKTDRRDEALKLREEVYFEELASPESDRGGSVWYSLALVESTSFSSMLSMNSQVP